MNTTQTAKPARLIITGLAAREISQHTKTYVLRNHTGWNQVQGMHECKHGCNLYARQRGCVVEYQISHSAGYGCSLGRDAATQVVPVSIRPAS